MKGTLPTTGDLEMQLWHRAKDFAAHGFTLPFGLGRLIFSRDPGDALHTAREQFQTNMWMDHFRDGRMLDRYELGSGLVTNVGVLSLANDFNWAAPSGAAINTLKLQNNHAIGTGVTGAAATDIALQTAANPTTTTAVAGTQTLVSAANSQKYQTVATLNITVGAAITEWGLFNSTTLSASTGTPFTAGSATTGTVTGTPLTASTSTVQGSQQSVFKDTTNGTPFWGLCTSNTTSVVTVPAWYKVTDGTLSGSNPANADAYVIIPVMWDHKVFSVITTVNGDTLTPTYQLTISSGG